MKTQALLSLLVTVALSACSGSGSVAQPPVTPCTAFGPPDLGATFIMPADKATGVSTTIGSVSFKVTNAGLFTGTFDLQAQAVPNVVTVTSVSYRTDATGAVTLPIPALQPHTTYVGTVIGGCPVVGGTLGTFTTQ